MVFIFFILTEKSFKFKGAEVVNQSGEPQKLWSENQQAAKNQHQNATNDIRDFGIFVCDTQLLDTRERDSEDDEIVDHVKENVNREQKLAVQKR